MQHYQHIEVNKDAKPEDIAVLVRSCPAGLYKYENGVLVKRRVISIGSRTFIISDEFYAVGIHDYRMMYRFHSDGSIVINGKDVMYNGKDVVLQMHFLGDVEGGSSGIGKLQLKSDNPYEAIEKSDTLIVNMKGTAFKSMVTILHANVVDSSGRLQDKLEFRKLVCESVFQGVSISDSEAEALELVIGSKSYIVIIGRNDIYGKKDMVRAGDCTGFGNVMVFDTSVEGNPFIILK